MQQVTLSPKGLANLSRCILDIMDRDGVSFSVARRRVAESLPYAKLPDTESAAQRAINAY